MYKCHRIMSVKKKEKKTFTKNRQIGQKRFKIKNKLFILTYHLNLF